MKAANAFFFSPSENVNVLKSWLNPFPFNTKMHTCVADLIIIAKATLRNSFA